MSVSIKSFVPETITAVREGSLEGMYEVAAAVADQAKALAPVAKINGGRLKQSIAWEEEGSDAAIVGSGVEYAVYQEYGTRKMAAQPFLRPAVDIIVNGTKAVKAMKTAMENSVRVKLGL